MCTPVLDPVCVPGMILNDAAHGMLQTVVEQIGRFITELIKIVVTGWLRLPSPQVADSPYGPPIGAVAQLRDSTTWLVTALAVGSLLYAAGRIAISRNGREAAELGRGVMHLVLLSGLGVPTVLLLTQIGDSYSDWIINRSTGGQFEQRVSALFVLAGPGAATSAIGLVGTIFVGFMLAFVLVVQIMLMFGRSVGLVLLTGLLPAAAAGGLAGRGAEARDRYVAWLAAFVLYKPAAATIYAGGFWLIGDGTSLTDVLSGIMTFVMALVALPALMRLITPAVGSLAAGAGGGAVHGAMVGASVATGAASIGGAIAGTSTPGRSSDTGQQAATGAVAAAGGQASMVAGAASQIQADVQRTAQAPARIAATAGATGAQGATGDDQ